MGAFKAVILLYVLVFISLLCAFLYLTYLSIETGRDPTAIEGMASKLLSIVEIVAGAVVGSLSTAVAFTFKSKKEEEK
jgi:small-conductance mechanosensitive channel